MICEDWVGYRLTDGDDDDDDADDDDEGDDDMQLLFEPQVYEARSRDVDIYMKPEVGIYIYIYSSEPPLLHQHACYYYYPYDYYPTTITTTNLESFRFAPIVPDDAATLYRSNFRRVEFYLISRTTSLLRMMMMRSREPAWAGLRAGMMRSRGPA